ncbi:MAG: hypothetical protein DMG24_15370 [Acidobacteria bacterium]|nr:MAG: hypothetical protein DMG24_15370 [Acidobacteriota bacterium]
MHSSARPTISSWKTLTGRPRLREPRLAGTQSRTASRPVTFLKLLPTLKVRPRQQGCIYQATLVMCTSFPLTVSVAFRVPRMWAGTPQRAGSTAPWIPMLSTTSWATPLASATICSGGSVVDYGDLLDTMGTAQTASAHYNAYQKERLGWLNYGASPSIETVTSSGTYTINTYELGGPGPNALKVLKSTDPTTGAKTWYYLEARQAVGFDAFLTNPQYYTENETTGVLFHIGTDGNSNSSDLIDMTPATPTTTGWFDQSLVAGQSFTDSTAGVTFTPTAVSGAGATVQITMNGNGSACAAVNPSVSVSPSKSQYVTSGTAVNFTATVIDNDNSSCSPATFNLAASLPSGWAGVWSATALSLSPGKSGSATLTVTSPVGTADGSYNVGVSATNASASSYKGSAAATYVISTAPLSISLTTNQSSYLPGQTVAISVSMLYGTSPDAGAGVTVTVTPPSGKSTTLKGTTGSNGVALLSYKLSRSAAAGTYHVQVGTTVTGASSTAGASTTFSVQ